MAVDAAETKTADGRAAGSIGRTFGPRFRAGQHPERALVQTEVRRGPLEIGSRGKCFVFQGQEHLEQSGRARRRQSVTDIRLDRADRALAGASRIRPQSDLRLSISTASPTGVPVAWHSIRSTSPGLQPACS